MQFPATAEVFHTTIQGFFVFASLISDYTLHYDQWIVTRPNFDGYGSAERKRWIAVLKTSMSYAVLEPLCYWVMTTVSNQSFWFLLMASFLHLHAVPGAIMLMGQCMLEILDKHKKICGDPAELAREEEGKANDEKEKNKSASPNDVLDHSDQPAPPKLDLRPCLDRHPLPKLYSFAPLLPVATAAASNAGLLFYTRYLSTADSQTWYDRFAFGWFAIALLCVFVYIMARWNNKIIHDACGRPLHTWGVTWDVLKYRLVALITMTLVCGAVRNLLSQDPFTWFGFSSEGKVYLLGTVDTSDGPGTSLENKKHAFDRMLAAIPPWVSTTISVTNCVCILGYLIYSRWQRSRRQRAQQPAAE